MKKVKSVLVTVFLIVAFTLITAAAVNFDQTHLKGSKFIQFAVAQGK